MIADGAYNSADNRKIARKVMEADLVTPVCPRRNKKKNAPHRAFVVFHRTYFEKGGTLEHYAFLFGEEVFIAESAIRLGLRILYDPRLRVLHSEHATTRSSAERLRYTYEAAKFCSERFFS